MTQGAYPLGMTAKSTFGEMNLPRNILLVSASTGTGHRTAAESLRRAYATLHPAYHVEHVDLLDLAPRWVRATYGTGYELIATRAPWLWRQMYHHTDGEAHDRARWSPVAQRLLFSEFQKLLLSRSWNYCLCTHFLPCQLAAGRPGLPPFSLAITDFTVHRFWVQQGVRRFFVATDAMATDLKGRLNNPRVDVTGIPISPRFAEAPNRMAARNSLGIDSRRRVALVMGGGLGIGVEESVREALLHSPPETLIIAITGSNAAVRERLVQLRMPPWRLRIEGYVDDVERFISASDFVITKPGGLTTSEALALGRPLIFTGAIPGQETGNARAVAAAGAALFAEDQGELGGAIRKLSSDGQLLMGLAVSAARLGRPGSARDVVERMETTVWQEGLVAPWARPASRRAS